MRREFLQLSTRLLGCPHPYGRIRAHLPFRFILATVVWLYALVEVGVISCNSEEPPMS